MLNKYFVALTCAFSPFFAAQAQVYTSSQFAAPFVPVTGGTVVSFSSPDDSARMVAIGFPFEYFGVTYNRINVATNGYAVLAAPCNNALQCGMFGGLCTMGACEMTFSNTGAPGTFPNPADPQSVIGPFWDDLYVQTGGAAGVPTSQVLTATEGSAPNRVFVIEWRNIGHYPSGTTGSMTYQIRLSESGTVRIAWGTGTAGNGGWSGDIGLENPDGTIGFAPNLACVQNASSCTHADFTSLANTVLEVGPVDGPELVALVSPPPGGDPGQEIDVRVSARNIGTQSTTVSITAEVYLSADSTINAMDTLLGRVTLPTIPARASRTATLTTNLPAVLMPGSYRIGAIIDTTNVVREASEGNNIAVSGSFLVGPDLSVTVRAPTPSGPGETLIVPMTIASVGSPVQSVLYRVVLSADARVDASDLVIVTATAAIAGQASLVVNASAVLPLNIQPGNYYALVEIDPRNAIAELDETNNSGQTMATFQVVGPDLAITEVNGPPVGYRGAPYPVTGTIRNVGGATARDLFYTFYLSDNQLVTATDPVLCEFGPITMAPAEVRMVTHTCTIAASAQTGQIFLGFIADSTTVVLEEDERDNIKFRRPAIEIRDPAPDFVTSELTPTPLGAVGESLAIGRVLDNIGNADGTVEYAIYLSRDLTIDPMSDLEIGRGMATLAAGGRSAGLDQARIPSSAMPGTYFLGYVLDPARLVLELDETNNTLVTTMVVTIDPGQLTIQTRELPQGTVGLPYQVDLSAVGGTGTYTWSVAAGDLPPGLSLDATTGRISGSPRRAADVRVRLLVVDGASRADIELRLLVAESNVDLDVITRSVPPAFVGRPFELPLTAIGGIPPYVWTMQGVLPPGLTLTAAGLLAGTGTMVGPSTVTFRVTDVAGTFVDRPITVRVIANDDALRFTSDILRDGVVNRTYGDRFRAENGQAPYAFALIEGTLPPGLMLDMDTIVGTPTVAGAYAIAMRVSDARGDFDTNRYVITIDETDDGVRFVTNALPAAVRGEEYFEEGGNPVRLKAISPAIMGDVTYRILAGDLPSGLTLQPTGAIVGAPTISGVFAFTAEARDSAGQKDHRALAIVVEEPPPPPITPLDPSGCSCSSSNDTQGAWALMLGALVLLAARRKSGLLALAFALFLPAPPANAQGVPYFLREEMVPYNERTGGTLLSFFSTDDDDVDFTLPFPFRYYGNDYTTVTVGTNGYVTFGGQSATSYQNASFPTNTTPNNLIAVWWDDLRSDQVRWLVEGTAPNRAVIIQWSSVRLGGSDPIRMQLWLHEGPSGLFELRYGSAGGVNLSASVGFENSTGSEGDSWRTCSPACVGSDLASLDGVVLKALQDGGTDITASSIVIPRSTFAGVPFSVEGTLSSIHQNPIGPFTYGVQLVPVGGGAGTTIFTSAPITLSAYQTLNTRDDVIIPVLTPPGRYRLALVVDSGNAIMEPDENNNSALSRTEIVVGERRADFTVTRIATDPEVTEPGGTVQVIVDLANVGNRDGTADWRLVLSANRVISADDTVVHSATINLPLITTRTATVPVTLPANLAPGRYTFGVLMDPEDRVLELSEVNNAIAARTPIEVGVDFVDVATETLPGGYVGVSYSAFLRGAGGDGQYTWAIASGTLPLGITLVASSGELRGTPTAAMNADFTVRVSSATRTAEQMLSMVIAERTGPLTIASNALAPAVVGQSYPPADSGPQRLRTVNASGDVVFRLLSTPPSGLELTVDGILQGVALNRGVFDIVVEARDATSTATRSIPLTVVEPGRLAIVAASLPNAVLDEEYRFQLSALGSTSTVTFSTTEVLPDGVTLTTSGLLVGVPTRAGLWRFSIQVSEGMARDDANFSLRVVGDDGFGITPSSLPVAEVNKPYDATLEVRGGTPPFSWSLMIQGQLPRGIRFEIERGTSNRDRLHFLGTPEAIPEVDGGVVSFLATVEDIAGRRAELPLAIRVVAPPPVIIPPPVDTGCSCTTEGSAGPSALLLLGLFGLIHSRRRREET